MRHLVILLFILASCNASETINSSPTVIHPNHAPAIAPLNLSEFHWRIMNEVDLKKLAEQLQKKPHSHISLYVLDYDNYVKLDMDLLELKRYIEQQHQVILFYRNLENGKIETLDPGKK